MKNNTASSTPAPAAAPAKQAPVKHFRLGRIKAAIWKNETANGAFYNVTFSRSYLDDKKVWHDVDSYGRDDLPLVAKLADRAHTFIFDELSKDE